MLCRVLSRLRWRSLAKVLCRVLTRVLCRVLSRVLWRSLLLPSSREAAGALEPPAGATGAASSAELSTSSFTSAKAVALFSLRVSGDTGSLSRPLLRLRDLFLLGVRVLRCLFLSLSLALRDLLLSRSDLRGRSCRSSSFSRVFGAALSVLPRGLEVLGLSFALVVARPSFKGFFSSG